MKKNLGFTLIELVVVMAIVSVLTGLATFNFQQARQRARDVQRKNDLKQLANALEVYKNDQKPQSYPATLEDLVAGGFIKAKPEDPRYKADNDGWVDYVYTINPANSLDYEITTCLENKGDPEKVSPVETCVSDAGVIMKVTTP